MPFSCTSFTVPPPSFSVLRCPLPSLVRLPRPLLLPHTFPSLSVSAARLPLSPPPSSPSPLSLLLFTLCPLLLHSIFFASTLHSTGALIPPPTVANVSNPGRFNNCFRWLQTPCLSLLTAEFFKVEAFLSIHFLLLFNALAFPSFSNT